MRKWERGIREIGDRGMHGLRYVASRIVSYWIGLERCIPPDMEMRLKEKE
jgi:hypothetical protein